MPPTTLLDLPSELVAIIINHMHPSCHLTFALASKSCLELSKDILARHAACHERSQSWSDILPLTIPKLIHMIHDDPVSAYYVRSLEFWGLRKRWNEWSPYALQAHNGSPPGWNNHDDNIRVDASRAGKAGRIYDEREIRTFRQLLRQIPDVPEDDWIRRLSNGDEGPVKFLLLAMLPRLSDLKIGYWISFRGSHLERGPFPFPDLQGALGSTLLSSGFRHLRRVAVGVDSDFVSTARIRSYYNFGFVAALYQLPVLESLFLNLSEYTLDYVIEESGKKYPRSIMPGESSIKHLFLQPNCCFRTKEIEQSIAGAAHLISYAQTSEDAEEVQTAFQSLIRYHADTLQSLNLYQENPSRGNRNPVYPSCVDWRKVSSLKGLRHITMGVVPFLQLVTEPEYWNTEADVRSTNGVLALSVDAFSNLKPLDLSSVLPESIQTISLTIIRSPAWAPRTAEALDMLVANNLQSGNLPNLSTIFFDNVRRLEDLGEDICQRYRVVHNDYALEDGALWFQRSTAAGQKRGVDVFTSLTHTAEGIERRKRELGIPVPITGRDLETDPRRNIPAFRAAAMEAAVEADALVADLL